jgi:alkyl hydroperoxide reductase subunit AhpC
MAKLRLGDLAPDFEQDTNLGPIRFHEWLDEGWAVLFSAPGDFKPHYRTPLGLTAKLTIDFAKRGVKMIALSTDRIEAGSLSFNFPVINDRDRKVSTLYGLIDPADGAGVALRSLFVIDSAHRTRFMMTYADGTHRDFHEILSVIESLRGEPRVTSIRHLPTQHAEARFG